MKFLCDHHRQSILTQPQQALAHWQQWMTQCNALISANQWPQACSLLGCSFEVAEWLLDKPIAQQPLSTDDLHSISLSPINRYMVSGHQLAECMGRCGRTELELHYLLTVHLQLIHYIKNRHPQYWLLKQQLQISLLMLSRYRNNHGSFPGYYDCCLETELYIKQCVH